MAQQSVFRVGDSIKIPGRLELNKNV